MFFVLVLLCTVGVMMVDGYLKLRKFQEELEESGIQEAEDAETSLWGKIRWNVLIPVSAIVLLILLWCFYFTYQDEIALRRSVLYLEVKPKQTDIPRIQAKQNLNVIIENEMRRKNTSSMFDKLWYTKRQEETSQ